MVGTEETLVVKDFAQVFGSSVEQKVLRGESCFDLSEREGKVAGWESVKKLKQALRAKEGEVDLDVFEKLEESTYPKHEQMRGKVNEALGWKNDDFFSLVEEVIGLQGAEIGETNPEEMAEIRDLIKQRKPALKTAGFEWQKAEGHGADEINRINKLKRNYIYRSLGALEALYDTLWLCSLVDKKELFLEAAKVVSANLTPKILRGDQKQRGVSVNLQAGGADYEQVRLLPPGGYTRIIKALISSSEQVL